MTQEGGVDRIGLANGASMTDAGCQSHQRGTFSSNSPVMLAHGYPNAHDHTFLSPYDNGFHQISTHNEPAHSTVPPTATHHSLFGHFSPTRPVYLPENFSTNLPTSQNCLSRSLVQSTQESEPALTFSQQDFLQCSPLQVTTAHPSLQVPLYAHSLQSDNMAQCFPFVRNHEAFYDSSCWPEQFTPGQTPWLEPSTLCYEEEQCDDAEDGFYDKPYAQLIYECLSQAPGHRMLLRDIYEWFVKYTRKPHESGTNGWQNSIRHNLSMNQVSGILPGSNK